MSKLECHRNYLKHCSASRRCWSRTTPCRKHSIGGGALGSHASGMRSAGVTLRSEGNTQRRPQPRVQSEDGQVQYEAGEGPCVETPWNAEFRKFKPCRKSCDGETSAEERNKTVLEATVFPLRITDRWVFSTSMPRTTEHSTIDDEIGRFCPAGKHSHYATRKCMSRRVIGQTTERGTRDRDLIGQARES